MAAKKQVSEKLDELMVSFGGFEASMKEGTRVRRGGGPGDCGAGTARR